MSLALLFSPQGSQAVGMGRDLAEEALRFLESCKGASFSIKDLQTKPLKRSPAPPITHGPAGNPSAKKPKNPSAATATVCPSRPPQIGRRGTRTYALPSVPWTHSVKRSASASGSGSAVSQTLSTIARPQTLGPSNILSSSP